MTKSKLRFIKKRKFYTVGHYKTVKWQGKECYELTAVGILHGRPNPYLLPPITFTREFEERKSND